VVEWEGFEEMAEQVQVLLRLALLLQLALPSFVLLGVAMVL
jgi:hypothetical protein